MKLPAALRLSPRWAPYVFLSPFVLLFGVFGMFPLLFSLWLAFQSLRSADFSVFVEIFVGQFFCSGDGGATAGHVFGFVEQAHGTDSN